MPDEPGKSLGPPPDHSRITWWRPTWRDIAATVGWGWILLAVAALVLAIALVMVLVFVGWAFTGALFKPVLLLGGGAIAVLGYVMNRAIQARQEPFCIFCGYSLTGLPDDYRCPECGRPYTWQQIDEYRRDPQWFIERWKAREKLPPADAPFDARPVRPRRRSRDGTG